MKKLILSVTAIGAMSLSGFAQGITFSDNVFTTYDTTINGVPNTTQDLNLELLYGSTANTVNTPVVTLLLTSSAQPTSGALGGVYSAAGDISAYGSILDNSGQEYNLPGGVTDYFQVLAWAGNAPTFQAAIFAGEPLTGTSAIFTEAIGVGSTSFPADITGVGVIALGIPEPSTLAMAGVGLASVVIFRRRNK